MYRTSNGRLAVVTATKILFILCVFYLYCFFNKHEKWRRRASLRASKMAFCTEFSINIESFDAKTALSSK